MEVTEQTTVLFYNRTVKKTGIGMPSEMGKNKPDGGAYIFMYKDYV
ncbi:MAG: hypothetical protein MJA29_06360 [Candidatus Omnitrophica bacterium]|nr:hypothetical protein [Candidatus Omnitrophota bacterium]